MQAAALQRQQGLLQKNLDQVCRAECRLSKRASKAREFVEREQRCLVDTTARQIRTMHLGSQGSESLHNQLAWSKKKELQAEETRAAFASAQELVEAAREQQVTVLCNLREETRAVEAALKQVGRDLERAVGEEEQAEHDGIEITADSPRQRVAEQLLREVKFVNASPQPPQAGLTPARSSSASRRLESVEKRQALREQDLLRTVEHLKEFEHNFKEKSELQAINSRFLQMQVDEHCQALENERARQKSTSSNVLKRYRHSQLCTQEAANTCTSLRTRYSALTTELHESCQALSSSRERQHRRMQLENSSQNEEHRSSKDIGKSREPSPGQVCRDRKSVV